MYQRIKRFNIYECIYRFHIQGILEYRDIYKLFIRFQSHYLSHCVVAMATLSQIWTINGLAKAKMRMFRHNMLV